jgi:HSP20 family molecular chaperone IbpA
VNNRNQADALPNGGLLEVSLPKEEAKEERECEDT